MLPSTREFSPARSSFPCGDAGPRFAFQFLEVAVLILPWGEPKRFPMALLTSRGLCELSYADSGQAGHSSGWLNQNWEPKATQLSLGPERRAWPGRRSPPGGRGVAPRIQPLPSPSTPPATLLSSSERPLLADRRGMSSGGSRHVTRRRSSSSPSRGSNFQPLPWEQRRAALAPPGRVRRRRWPAALTRTPGVWVSLQTTRKTLALL